MSQEFAEDRFDDITIFTTEDVATRVKSLRGTQFSIWATHSAIGYRGDSPLPTSQKGRLNQSPPF